MNLTDLTDQGLSYVVLSVCETNAEGELRPETEKSFCDGYNATFSTLRTYKSDEEAVTRAKRVLDEAIAGYKKRGYALRCAPKTIDVDNHNWRRIARVGKKGEPSMCLQVMVDAIAPYFDGWIY